MKKRLLAALATGLLVVGMGGMANAIPVATVGSLDDLVAWTNLPGGTSPAAEEDWVQDALFDLGVSDWEQYFTVKDEDLAGEWFPVDGTTYSAHALTSSPDYFLLKTGTGSSLLVGGVSATHFLFDNFSSLDWAVISLAEMGFDSNITVTKISHISEFDGGGNEVPEPATMLLFGTGLAGLAGVARRRKKA